MMIWVLLLFSTLALAQDDKGTSLTVNISGIEESKGQLVVSLWPSESAWDEKKALHRLAIPLQDGGGTWSCENLIPGNYAVTVFYDKNSNMKMDRHWYGPPKEKGAASNGAKAQTFGPPKWQDMEFEITAEPKTIEIKFE
jgi:uncharacterized protein (DUF2141 family)